MLQQSGIKTADGTKFANYSKQGYELDYENKSKWPKAKSESMIIKAALTCAY